MGTLTEDCCPTHSCPLKSRVLLVLAEPVGGEGGEREIGRKTETEREKETQGGEK